MFHVTISGLKQELPIYLAKSADVSPSIDVLEWWKGNEDDLPKWLPEACCCSHPQLLLREFFFFFFFSLLNASFEQSQSNCLEDYIETSIMLQYFKQPVTGRHCYCVLICQK